MPGPNSSPNGDKSLVDGTTIYCETCRGRFNKRAHLARHGQLRTGKTGK